MFKKILYPTDFSPHSNEIMSSIINLKATGTKEIILLHIIDKRLFAQFPEVSNDVIHAIRASAEEKVTEAKETLEKAGLKVDAKIEIGIPFHQIVSLAKAEAVSLIVMGSHGRSLVEEMLLGSTTENVLRHATVPLLIEKFESERDGEEVKVKRRHKNPFEKILFPTDFSECSMNVIPYLIHLKSCGTKEIIISHIQDMTKLSPHLLERLPEFENIDEDRLGNIKTELIDAGIPSVKTIIREGVPWNELDAITNEEDVTMIAVGSHGKSMVGEMFIGSLSGKIVRRSSRPVLVVRRK